MKSGLSGPASLTSFVHPPPSRWGMLFFVPKPRTTRTSTPLRPPKTHAIGFVRIVMLQNVTPSAFPALRQLSKTNAKRMSWTFNQMFYS